MDGTTTAQERRGRARAGVVLGAVAALAIAGAVTVAGGSPGNDDAGLATGGGDPIAAANAAGDFDAAEADTAAARDDGLAADGAVVADTAGYEIVELTYAEPQSVLDADGEPVVTDRAYRITIHGDFPVRSLPAAVLLDGEPVGYATETPALDGLAVVTFATDAVADGARLGYRYGDEAETVVAEQIEVAR